MDNPPDTRVFLSRSFGLLFGAGEINTDPDTSYFIEGNPFAISRQSNTVDVAGRVEVKCRDGGSATNKILEYQSLRDLAGILSLTQDQMGAVIARMKTVMEKK